MASIIQTIGDRCKRCYHCVRHCPAKAIKVVEGQATVVEERCIACGNCYRVCAQNAKSIESGIEMTQELLASGGEVVAALAPSFPAAFDAIRPGQLISALRRLGFTRVVEVAFGADLVARRYRELIATKNGKPVLTSPCPALVAYVEKFAPQLVAHLAPIVSPMVALGRALKQKHWPDAQIVFIGPCTAKKNEIRDPDVSGVIEAVLTFDELRTMLADAQVDVAAEPDDECDPPRAALGRVFPVSGGLLRTAAVQQDVLDNSILVTDGMQRVQRLIEDLQKGEIHAGIVDVLLCEGCINGPVMGTDAGEVHRKELVSDYVRNQPGLTAEEAEAFLAQYDDVDLSREFTGEPVTAAMPAEAEIKQALARVNKFSPEDELNCGACGYATCREKAIAVCQGLAEAEMCLPYLVEETQKALVELTRSHDALANTQERLVQAEKLAAIGQLAAGVAHQVNNPLSTVLLYSHLLLRQLTPADPGREDLQVIADEAARCRNIMVALLNFARQNRLKLGNFDLNQLLSAVLTMETRKVGEVEVVQDFAPDLPPLFADGDQLTQVFQNIIDNAFEAMGGSGQLTVATRRQGEDSIEVQFADTGPGLEEEVIPRVFEPFFTTKPPGQGTGLGLAIAKGIVKMHHGDITAANRPEGGAAITVRLLIRTPVEPDHQAAIGEPAAE
ncbi:MAG: 4Fe-4S dicluster domain-containing protein [Armatimonadetes bacterium]|nr:4Fe-4S dicluster domain-containing protein [Armatimonadota bacterium]